MQRSLIFTILIMTKTQLLSRIHLILAQIAKEKELKKKPRMSANQTALAQKPAKKTVREVIKN